MTSEANSLLRSDIQCENAPMQIRIMAGAQYVKTRVCPNIDSFV
jgi:hypothetical protein